MHPFPVQPPDDSRPPSAPTADTAFGTWRFLSTSDLVSVLGLTGTDAVRVPLQQWLGDSSGHDADAAAAAWSAALSQGDGWGAQCTVEVGGRRHRLLARGAVTDLEGARTMQGVWVDVTAEAAERERTQQETRAQAERLRLAQEAGRVGAFEWRIREQRVEWSPELERLYGLPPGSFGSSVTVWAEHVHPDDVGTAVASVERALASGRDSCEFEFRAVLPDGAHRWLAGRVCFTYAPDGTPLKMIGVNTDIDARKRSEAALKESQGWFQHLADAMPIMIWAAAPDGLVDYVNEAWRHYAGAVEPADWRRAVHPDDAEGLASLWDAAVARRERHEARARIRRESDGHYRWHTVRAVPIQDTEGAVMRWIGACIDDHELRMLVEANQQLLASEQRARQAAEDAGRMKDEFLATLGHELRTPLNAITGWTSLLRRGDLGAEETNRAVEVIERNAQAQRHLIDELLDVSRIISGHVRLDLQPLFLEDIVTHAIEAIRPVTEARQQRLEVRLGQTQQPLTGDPQRLQQVFSNLLGNAVKFTRPGGLVSVTLERQADDAVVHVTDDGIGIAPAFLPFVFDRFRQAEAPGTRKYGGLGLGLSIVRQIVHMHGGRVTAHSEGEGTGATFTVSLPLAGPSLAPTAPIPAAQRTMEGTASLRGLSILVIEDDPDSREMLSVLLENAGAVAVAAASVTDALRLLGDLEVDVVLSDIGMPERDGFDLIRSLRTFPNPRVRRAPAIAVTAFAREEDRTRILGAGFDAHVSKPVEPVELFASIADVRRRRAADEDGDSSPEARPDSTPD